MRLWFVLDSSRSERSRWARTTLETSDATMRLLMRRLRARVTTGCHFFVPFVFLLLMLRAHPLEAQDRPERTGHTRAPEELPDGADFGPAQSSLPPRPTPADASEPLMPNLFQFHLGAGVALDASIDDVLVAHGFAESPFAFSGDIGFLGRLEEWFYLGARVGGRGRGWSSNDRSPATAGGVDALALAHLRAHLGRIVDLGIALGVGLGWGGISMTSGSSTTFAPRLHGSVLVGFRLAPGIRFMTRIGWDWFSLYDLDRYGSDLDLGGASLSLGFEVRR